MSIRVGINGFGRIGRNFFRAARHVGVDRNIVAANDLCPRETMAHLLKYDSVLGLLPAEVSVVDDGISIDGDVLTVLSERSPVDLPWDDLGVDLVVESTGIFNSREASAQHLESEAPYVVVSGGLVRQRVGYSNRRVDLTMIVGAANQ